MLSDSVYKRAQRELSGRPTHLSLLKYLWPLVKDVDFEVTKKLKVKRPEHELVIFAKKPTNPKLSSYTKRELISTDKMTLYSHRTIRRTVHALGLFVGNRFPNGSFIIQKEKQKKSRRKNNVRWG